MWYVILSAASAAFVVVANEATRDLSIHEISLEQFNKVMLTEAIEEFGARRLSQQESNNLWRSAMDYEWSIAEERENWAHLDTRRATRGLAQGLTPFLVCDMNYNKTGEACMATVMEHLGTEHLIVSRNYCDSTT
jgi:hypothetical protein